MNLKYYYLNSIDYKTVLREKSVAELAKELAEKHGHNYRTLHSCITWRKNTWLSTEDQKLCKKETSKGKVKRD